MSVAYFNGTFMPLEDVHVSPMDRGFLFGDGVYEVIPVYAGRLFRLEEHLDRLDRSMQGIDLPNPYSRDRWRALLDELVKRNGSGEQSVYFQVTRGVAVPRSHAYPHDTRPTVFAMTRAVAASSGASPMSAITRHDNRWEHCDIKAIALLANCMHKQAAVSQGAHESILLRDGMVTEGSSSNVFVVKDGAVATPPKSSAILPGITRDVALELMHQAGMTVEERAVSEQALRDADEVWVTSSTLEISPVVTLDGEAVGSGAPGPVWARVHDLMQGLKRSLMAA